MPMTHSQFESWMGELGRRGVPEGVVGSLRMLRGALVRLTAEQLADVLSAWERGNYREALAVCYPLLDHGERVRLQAMGQERAFAAAEAAWRAQAGEQKLAMALVSALVTVLV